MAILPCPEKALLLENNRDRPGIRPNVFTNIITIISYLSTSLITGVWVCKSAHVYLDERENGGYAIDVRDLLPTDFMQDPSTVYTTC
jgi:hypothetical protein